MNETSTVKRHWWNKRRVTAAVVAAALFVTTLTAGTFSWYSVSQSALNEAKADNILPGGRLHDDFDGSNKDVYVENYGTLPIYARIQLSEYMEVGSGAGLKSNDADYAAKGATSLVAGANINDPATWTVHGADASAADDAQFHNFWDWTLGGRKVFMPTFNRDKSSNATDITGLDTFGITSDEYQHRVSDPVNGGVNVFGKDGGHNQYSVGDTETGLATYKDANKNGTETHTAQDTLPGSVITMAQWIANGSVPGPYWVLDTDGWAYWAQAIMPGTATGLLLDKITLNQEMDDNWYYAINVVGQMASLNDISQINDGTSDGQQLIKIITAGDILGVAINGPAKVPAGGTADMTADVTGSSTNIDKSVTWTVDKDSEDLGITIDTDGTLHVPAGTPKDTEVTVTATSVQNPTESASKVVTVTEIVTIFDASQAGATFNPDTYNTAISGAVNTAAGMNVMPVSDAFLIQDTTGQAVNPGLLQVNYVGKNNPTPPGGSLAGSDGTYTVFGLGGFSNKQTIPQDTVLEMRFKATDPNVLNYMSMLTFSTGGNILANVPLSSGTVMGTDANGWTAVQFAADAGGDWRGMKFAFNLADCYGTMYIDYISFDATSTDPGIMADDMDPSAAARQTVTADGRWLRLTGDASQSAGANRATDWTMSTANANLLTSSNPDANLGGENALVIKNYNFGSVAAPVTKLTFNNVTPTASAVCMRLKADDPASALAATVTIGSQTKTLADWIATSTANPTLSGSYQVFSFVTDGSAISAISFTNTTTAATPAGQGNIYLSKISLPLV